MLGLRVCRQYVFLLLSCSYIRLSVLQRVVPCRLCLLARCHCSLCLFCVLCCAFCACWPAATALCDTEFVFVLCSALPFVLAGLYCHSANVWCTRYKRMFLPSKSLCLFCSLVLHPLGIVHACPPARTYLCPLAFTHVCLCPSDAIIGLLASAHVCLCVSDSTASAALACR